MIGTEANDKPVKLGSLAVGRPEKDVVLFSGAAANYTFFCPVLHAAFILSISSGASV